MSPESMKASFHDRRAVDALLAELPGGQTSGSILRKALYRRHLPWDQALAQVPSPVSQVLDGRFTWSVTTLVDATEAPDGSTKALWQTREGHRFESVLMRHQGRTTLCVSCQVGCPMGCTFCSTGQLGLVRDLDPGEILDQAAWASGLLAATGQRLRNVVFMGMGEPLLNLDAVGAALGALVDQQRFEVAPRYLSVSTCGVTPAIEPFFRRFPLVKLAVSLHAPRQDLRDELMPGCRRWPLDGLFDALDRYTAATGHRLFFEYVMIEGINDTEREAAELAALVGGRDAHVNLIPFNPSEGDDRRPSGRPALDRFQAALTQVGVPSTVRRSAGETIAAACGQLAGKAPSGNSKGRASSRVEA